MSFAIKSISAKAHELEAKVEAADDGRAQKIAQVIAKHIQEIAKEIGGYVTVSGGGKLNSVEGQPGDSVWLNVNSLPNPAAPTPSGLIPPEASGANPQPADGSPAAAQGAVPQPVVLGAEGRPDTRLAETRIGSSLPAEGAPANPALSPPFSEGPMPTAGNVDAPAIDSPLGADGSGASRERLLHDPSQVDAPPAWEQSADATADAREAAGAGAPVPGSDVPPTGTPGPGPLEGPDAPGADTPLNPGPVEPAVDITVPAPPFSDPPAGA